MNSILNYPRNLLLLVLIGIVGCSGPPQQKRAPSVPQQRLKYIYKALEEATELELYSLQPIEVKEGNQFGGWQSMGSIKVEGDSRDELVKAFREATAFEVGMALCFDPHHGVRIIKGDSHIDLVICFSCQQFEIIQDEKKETYSIDSGAQPVFNRLLKDAKLPYPDKA